MENFVFYNPVKIIFGKGTVGEIGREAIKYGKKALMVYGGGSIKKNGVYSQAVSSLKENNIDFVEFSGVVSNPVLSHTREGIKMAKKHKVDMIIAIGGGSVIDESKAIAAGSVVDHDVWDFFIGKATSTEALPLLTVLTIAATGSEMNSGAVITNEETKQKYALMSESIFPKVSILDPESTATVHSDYTAYGAVDAISHVFEAYFSHSAAFTVVQDNIIEGLVRSIIKCEEILLEDPSDYNGRAGAMWSATMALNGIPSAGIGPSGFPVHMIEHSLSAIYNIPHGAGLAIVIPAWLKYFHKEKSSLIAKFGRNVFAIKEVNDMEAAGKGIELLEKWFKKIGAPTRLGDVHIQEKDIKDIAENALKLAELWQLHDYNLQVIADILSLAV
jgi:alcohol dehydrogenase YqhD (iron-dependent ADH family)